MAISVVQFQSSAAAGANYSGNFTSPVTPGSSIIVWLGDYNTNGTAISATIPHYNGGAVTGAALLFGLQNPGTTAAYSAAWLLPDVSGSGTSVTFTVTNGFSDSNAGWAIAEVSGLGTSPSVDSGASPNPATASSPSGGSANPSSGATGAITAAPEIIIGGMMTTGTPANPGTPWTNLTIAAGFPYFGYQVAVSSGGSYTYSTTAASCEWAAGAAAIKATTTSGPAGQVPALMAARTEVISRSAGRVIRR